MEENLSLFMKLRAEQRVSVLVEVNEEQYHIHPWGKHQLLRFFFFLMLSDFVSCSHYFDIICKPNYSFNISISKTLKIRGRRGLERLAEEFAKGMLF